MPANEYQAITFETMDRIGIITMNQPERRNALSPEMRQDFLNLIPTLQYDTNLGAIVLQGTDGVFCAGGDLKNLAQALENRNTAVDRQRLYRHHDWFQKLLNLEIPVIAAIDGAAYGAGFSIALSADFILCSDRAKLCCVFPRIGLVPDVGAFFTLPRIVGLQPASFQEFLTLDQASPGVFQQAFQLLLATILVIRRTQIYLVYAFVQGVSFDQQSQFVV